MLNEHDDHTCDDIFEPGGYLREQLFKEDAWTALFESLEFARQTRWDSIRSPHVFMGLMSVNDPCILYWADRLGADLPRLVEQFQELFLHEKGDHKPLLKLHREFMSDNVIRLLRDACIRAVEHDRDAVAPIDLLIGLFTAPHSIVAECFERIGVTAARLTELAVIAEQNDPKVV
jgi:ATP-dependent Clp protease ATP-binding subunit ClpA